MYQGKKVIGICSAYLDERFHMRMVNRLFHELFYRDYRVVVFGFGVDMYFYNNAVEGEMAICDLINYDILDGLIVFPETIKQESVLDSIIADATGAGVFVVSIGRECEGCYNVVYDTDSSFEKLVRHVIEYHNLKEVNFIAGYEENEVSERRLQIYKKVLEENNILFEEDRVGYGDFWEGPTRKVMENFMKPSKVPPEAIICANDSMAIAACDYLKEHQFRVPEDIIVTGIDGIEEGVKHSPGITTCVRDEVNDAKKIADMISELLEDEMVEDTLELSYHIQLSQSCGCQENYLFDSAMLVAELSTNVATNKADVRYYSQMSEDFLCCEDMDAFEELVSNYLSENSFLCINSDLSVEGEEENDHYSGSNAFTDDMNVIVKDQGDIRYMECSSKMVIPEIDKFIEHARPVIILPVHFSNKVVGYFGTWYKVGEKLDTPRILHFLFQFNNSAGVRLKKK